MSAVTIQKFKWFWFDQDAEQEQWLRAMAQQGLHLRKLNSLQQWTFVKGAPADVVYAVDYDNKTMTPAYRTRLENTGWKHVMDHLGWQYWRAPVIEGKGPEIFTEAGNKRAKFKRLLILSLFGGMPLLYIGTRAPAYLQQQLSAMPAPLVVVLAVAALYNVLSVIRLGVHLLKPRLL
jgi:hypothetical protein